jgi:anti-sigma factor RsiW
MIACREIEPLLAERASGDLAPGDEARLEAHLGGCPGCRRELAAYRQAIDLARVPADVEAGRAFAALVVSTLAAWKRRRRWRSRSLAAGLGLAVAAAAALAFAPTLSGRGQRPRVVEVADTSASQADTSEWEADVDSALAASDALDAEGWYPASATYGSSDDQAEDAALAAFDEAAL